MGDTKIDYDEKFGMNTFKREICNVMGEKFWDALTENNVIGLCIRRNEPTRRNAL